jgi:hypothetical protein
VYAWLWRHIPGPLPIRLLVSLAVLVGVVALLFFVIFPAIDPHLPWNNVNVSNGGTASGLAKSTG